MLNNFNELLSTIFIIIFTVYISGCISNDLSDNDVDTISAIHGRIMAEEFAKSWKNDTMLYMVTSDSTYRDGLAESWSYRFYSNSTIMDDGVLKHPLLFVYVNVSGIINFNDNFFRSAKGIDSPIINWTIDSTDAIEIAKSNETLKSFLDSYPEVKPGFNLRVREEYFNKSVWSISWWRGTPFGTDRADIVIDASTGEVLFIEVRYG